MFLISFTVRLQEAILDSVDPESNRCPCPLTGGVRLREVENVVLERINCRDRGLVSAYGRCV